MILLTDSKKHIILRAHKVYFKRGGNMKKSGGYVSAKRILSTKILLPQITFLAIAKVISEDLDIRQFTNYDNAIKWLCQQVSVKVPLISHTNISRTNV